MEKAIIGRKIGMSQIFDEAGKVIPVTVIEAGPCVVVQKKTEEKDGYNAVQLGFQDVPERKLTKPEMGHLNKAGVAPKKYLREFDLENGLQSAEPGSPVLLSFGGNDVDYDWAAISETPKERHDPHVLPEQFAENMAQMVRDARGAGLIPVLLTLPPIDSERYFSWVTRGLEKGENVLRWLGDVERIYRTHRGYSEILCQVARTVNAHLIDVRGAFERAGDSLRRLCVDGIHPNAEGHALIGQALTEYALAHGF